MGNLRRALSAARSRIRGTVRSAVLGEHLPDNRRDDDLFLVEFPKSGITWLSFLMINVNLQLTGDARKVTFFNYHDFIPEADLGVHMVGPLAQSLGYRCVKSHATYVARYRKVFYLVRDPRDVMVSYFAYRKGLGQWRGTLEQFVAHREYGIKAWVEHVTGWLNGVQPYARFALVRYEDLIADTRGQLKRLYGLLGVSVTDEIIATAIERSSIETMRKLEEEYAVDHPALRNQVFVRRSRPGGPRNALPEALRCRIESEGGAVMERLGYARKAAARPEQDVPFGK